MKTFYGDTYISEKELQKIGITYPIKLEYYKTYQENPTNQVNLRYRNSKKVICRRRNRH